MLSNRPSLADYLTTLQSEGQVTFTRDQAITALGMTKATFLKAAARLRKRRLLQNPRPSFYIIVPPQFTNWEAPPPTWYIDALMRHEGRPYYVGLLKAAELHGASHHAVMEFQVVTTRQLKKIRAGRSWITFYYRKDIQGVLAGIIERKTDTGSMKLSTPELTSLDLLRYMHAVGGVAAIATVLTDLVSQIDSQKLASLALHFERATVQRLGYLLERLGHAETARPLHDLLFQNGKIPWVALEPERRTARASLPKPVERNEHWHVRVTQFPEIDL